MNLQKRLLFILLLVSLLGGGAFFIFRWAEGGGELTFESWESQTAEGGRVFNRIRLFSFQDQDVWMMNQSHHGLRATPGQWERLAIVVDKTVSPRTARFYQFRPGPLEWAKGTLPPRQEFRVSCFLCHANGPRAIRPHPEAALLWRDRLKKYAWNWRIKAYGPVVAHSAHAQEDPGLKTAFRSPGKLDNHILKVKTCQICHRAEGFWRREPLRRQNFMSIAFLLKTEQMPPPGFRISAAEKKEIQRFLEGF